MPCCGSGMTLTSTHRKVSLYAMRSTSSSRRVIDEVSAGFKRLHIRTGEHEPIPWAVRLASLAALLPIYAAVLASINERGSGPPKLRGSEESGWRTPVSRSVRATTWPPGRPIHRTSWLAESRSDGHLGPILPRSLHLPVAATEGSRIEVSTDR